MTFGFTVVAWPLIAGICLAIGFIHFLVWLRRSSGLADLAFFGICISTSALILSELYLIHSSSPERYAEITRWCYVPITTFTLFTLLFLVVSIGTKKLWLAYGVAVLRCVALLIDFQAPSSLFYKDVDRVTPMTIWSGETLYVGEGPANPWQLIGQLSTLLFMVFVIDSMLEAVRRQNAPEERRRVLVICLSIVATIAITVTSTALIHWGVLIQPFHLFVSFMLVVVAISSELSKDLIKASILGGKLVAANTELKKNQQHMDMISEAAAVAMWELDVQRNSMWMNDQAIRVLGFDANESIDLQRFLNTIHEDDRAAFNESVAAALSRDEVFQHEYRTVTPDAEERWIMTRGRIERDLQSRQPLVIRGVSLDISERKQMEHLSRIMLLSELVGPLAHELNQPLTAILSNSQAALRFLAQDSPDLDEIRQILRDISADDKRASDVIHNLRSMLKKEQIRTEKLEANELVADVVRLMHYDMLETGIQHTLNLACDLPPIDGVRVQLQQVLLNLVLNACDAMRDPTGTHKNLVISTEMDTTNCIVFRVRDQGQGISDQFIDRVFDPFFTTKSHGLGLGLVVCRRIVDSHGGRIWAERNSDQGASFCFSIPIANTAITAPSASPPASAC